MFKTGFDRERLAEWALANGFKLARRLDRSAVEDFTREWRSSEGGSIIYVEDKTLCLRIVRAHGLGAAQCEQVASLGTPVQLSEALDRLRAGSEPAALIEALCWLVPLNDVTSHERVLEAVEKCLASTLEPLRVAALMAAAMLPNTEELLGRYANDAVLSDFIARLRRPSS